MTNHNKVGILYSNLCVGFTKDKVDVAVSFKFICDGMSEAGTLGYYRGDLEKIASKLGLSLEEDTLES